MIKKVRFYLGWGLFYLIAATSLLGVALVVVTGVGSQFYLYVGGGAVLWVLAGWGLKALIVPKI